VNHITRDESEVDILKVNSNDSKQTTLPKRELYVTNIGFETTEETIRDYFSPFGTLIKVKLILDRDNRSKGKAFVEFSTLAEAAAALE